MRFQLSFELENSYMNIDYRKNFVSFIKKSVSDYDKEFYEKLYHQKDNIIKPFVFAIFFEQVKFDKEKLEINGRKCNVVFSVAEYGCAMMLLNSFRHQLHQKFSLDKNSMTLESINLLVERKITSDTINVKFLSPLIVKTKDSVTRKDHYLSWEADGFEENLKTTIEETLQFSKIDKEILNTFSIKPIAPKKLVIKNYGIYVECTSGLFELKGDRTLLDYLYKAGIGSKRSMGFGCFQIVS